MPDDLENPVDDAEIAMKPHSEFGRILKNMRIQKLNISQVELSKRLNLPQSTVSRLESGRVEPRYHTLIYLIEKTTKDARDFFPKFNLYED